MTPGETRWSARSLFTSARERRLWIWTLVVVVAIYSTLGVVRPVATVLRERGVLAATFGLGLLLVGAAVVTQAWRARLFGAELGVALGVAACYVLVLVRIAMPEERTHLIEYSVVAVLIHEALTERAGGRGGAARPALSAALAATLVGAVDEGIQALLPDRVFDLRDIGFNATAALMAVAASLALRSVRSRRSAAR